VQGAVPQAGSTTRFDAFAWYAASEEYGAAAARTALSTRPTFA
jgi:hypothetical protein